MPALRVYIGMFAREPSFAPGVKIADIDPATAGVYHAADLPFWLGTQDSFNLFRQTRAWSDADRSLSAQMMDTLIAFADTGNPNTARVAWAPWSPDNETEDRLRRQDRDGAAGCRPPELAGGASCRYGRRPPRRRGLSCG